MSDDFDYMLEDAQRPHYRYLEAPPEPEYGRFERRARWVFLLAVGLAVVLFLAGCLVAGLAGALGGP